MAGGLPRQIEKVKQCALVEALPRCIVDGQGPLRQQTIWPDHQDTLVNRDSGWIQLYARNVQEIYDLTLCAFRVAEHDDISLPVLVAYDGFILSHANESYNFV